VSVLRDGHLVTAVTSPYPVRDDPPVQDLQYVGTASP
jgi:hypothetical protein